MAKRFSDGGDRLSGPLQDLMNRPFTAEQVDNIIEDTKLALYLMGREKEGTEDEIPIATTGSGFLTYLEDTQKKGTDATLAGIGEVIEILSRRFGEVEQARILMEQIFYNILDALGVEENTQNLLSEELYKWLGRGGGRHGPGGAERN